LPRFISAPVRLKIENLHHYLHSQSSLSPPFAAIIIIWLTSLLVAINEQICWGN
jgi:hypothetical protein